MKKIEYAFITFCVLCPLAFTSPPSAHPALVPLCCGHYSLAFVIFYLFFIAVLMPLGLEIYRKHTSGQVPGWLRRLRVVGVYAWFCLLSATVGLEAVLLVNPNMIPDWALKEMPHNGRILFKGYYRGEIPDPILEIRLRPGLEYIIEGNAEMGDLAAHNVARPNDEEKEVLDYDGTHKIALDERGYRGICGAGDKRIMFLGDSFLYCSRLPNESIWCVPAAESVGASCVNMGIFSYGVPREAEVLRREIDYYKPNLVVLCIFEANDLYNAETWVNRQLSGVPEWQSQRRGTTWIDRSPMLMLAGVLYNDTFAMDATVTPVRENSIEPFRGEIKGRKVSMGFANGYLGMLEAGPKAITEHSGWYPTWSAVQRCQRLCEDRGAKFMVALIPSKPSVYAWHILPHVSKVDVLDAVRFQPRSIDRIDQYLRDARKYRNAFWEVLARHCYEEKIPFLNMRPAFFKAAEKGAPQLYRAFDTHWSIEGHKLAGDTMAEYLKQHPELMKGEYKPPKKVVANGGIQP
jgi:hypothetical protein